MELAIYIVALIITIISGISLIFSLPGLLFVAIINTLLALYKGIAGRELYVILAWLLWVVPEGGEYLLSFVASKLASASSRTAFFAILGGIIGAVVGAPFLLGFGAILGVMIGSFIAAFVVHLFEGNDLFSSIKVGMAVMISKVVAMLIRFVALFAALFVQYKIMFGG